MTARLAGSSCGGIGSMLVTVPRFVVVPDTSIANVTLPNIGRGLHFSDKDRHGW